MNLRFSLHWHEYKQHLLRCLSLNKPTVVSVEAYQHQTLLSGVSVPT